MLQVTIAYIIVLHYSWYGVMRKCWEYEPKKRPGFAAVRQELDQMFVQAPGEDYYYYKR